MFMTFVNLNLIIGKIHICSIYHTAINFTVEFAPMRFQSVVSINRVFNSAETPIQTWHRVQR